jgi:hypothetical protein
VAKQLLAVLIGKARSALAEVEPLAEYAIMKETILAWFEVTLEALGKSTMKW